MNSELAREKARQFRHMGPSFVSPEWANADGFDEAVEREAERVLDDRSADVDLIERAARSREFTDALHGMRRAIERHEQGHINTAFRDRAMRHASTINELLIRAAREIAAEELDR